MKTIIINEFNLTKYNYITNDQNHFVPSAIDDSINCEGNQMKIQILLINHKPYTTIMHIDIILDLLGSYYVQHREELALAPALVAERIRMRHK